jgi:hypothetical protein
MNNDQEAQQGAAICSPSPNHSDTPLYASLLQRTRPRTTLINNTSNRRTDGLQSNFTNSNDELLCQLESGTRDLGYRQTEIGRQMTLVSNQKMIYPLISNKTKGIITKIATWSIKHGLPNVITPTEKSAEKQPWSSLQNREYECHRQTSSLRIWADYPVPISTKRIKKDNHNHHEQKCDWRISWDTQIEPVDQLWQKKQNNITW